MTVSSWRIMSTGRANGLPSAPTVLATAPESMASSKPCTERQACYAMLVACRTHQSRCQIQPECYEGVRCPGEIAEGFHARLSESASLSMLPWHYPAMPLPCTPFQCVFNAQVHPICCVMVQCCCVALSLWLPGLLIHT